MPSPHVPGVPLTDHRTIDRDAARRRGVPSDRPDTYDSHVAAWPEGAMDMDVDRHDDNTPACYGSAIDVTVTARCRCCSWWTAADTIEEAKQRVRVHQGRDHG